MNQVAPKKFKRHHLVLLVIGTVVIAALVWLVVFVEYKVSMVNAEGLTLIFPNQTLHIPASQLDFSHNGFAWLGQRLRGKATYDTSALQTIVTNAAATVQGTVKNPGVTIQGGQASLDTTSAAGLVLDQTTAQKTIARNLDFLQNKITLQMVQQQPIVSIAAAQQAVDIVQKVLAAPIPVTLQSTKLTITPTDIGEWVTQTPQNGRDYISFDQNLIATTLEKIAAPYTQQEQDLDFDLDANGNATNLTAPKDGIGIDTQSAVQGIVALLQSRIDGTAATSTQPVALPLQTVHGAVSAHAQSLGIEQLIGTATTPFTGSTKNRIHNITVGANKLNGTIVPAGQEFSTIKTLGDIGPETGYVEELVILGPNTVPAYGGGLCQVSTTLFRAILNAGLPITERQNHSYRVSFYEKDGDGKSIGPGLDATIYDPSPDLKFMNDTGHPVMITDQIVGTKITFSLYGTSDGRTSTIIGPTIVDTLPAPAPETVYSATLPAGEVKQTEFSHTGADTTATYEIHYANGTTKTQVFNSHYHGLPAIYITNNPALAAPATAAPSTTPTTPATPAD